MRTVAVILACICMAHGNAGAQKWRGMNVIQTTDALWGSRTASASLERLKGIGANTVAIVPFLYQPSPDASVVEAGSAVSREQVVQAIRSAHVKGFRVMLKPHVWVPGTWAGAIRPLTDAAWTRWFQSYTQRIVELAKTAQAEDVEDFAVGVELRGTVQRPEWSKLIELVRLAYKGRITFVADNVEQAMTTPLWPKLDFISISEYPALGADATDATMAAHMNASLDSVSVLQRRFGKPVWVAEVGIRSAEGAQREPWISAEERSAASDELLQARVIALWLDAIEQRPWIEGVLIWRWFTNHGPTARGDTDFTVQGKMAEGVLLSRWRMHDAKHP